MEVTYVVAEPISVRQIIQDQFSPYAYVHISACRSHLGMSISHASGLQLVSPRAQECNLWTGRSYVLKASAPLWQSEPYRDDGLEH